MSRSGQSIGKFNKYKIGYVMKRILCVIAAAGSIIIAGGCASTPTDSGYLSNYSELQQGKYLEKQLAHTDGIKKTANPKIMLGSISVDKISDKKDVSVKDCVAWLTTGLEKEGMISAKNSKAELRMDLAITDMSPGSAANRILAGELGAGHAHVQIEGRVVDIKSGKVLFSFADKQGSSGEIGLDDLGGDAGASLVEQMIVKISKNINKEIRLNFSSAK